MMVPSIETREQKNKKNRRKNRIERRERREEREGGKKRREDKEKSMGENKFSNCTHTHRDMMTRTDAACLPDAAIPNHCLFDPDAAAATPAQ